MLAEESRRLPENDRLTIVPGIIGSYPNFFFSVEKNQLREFAKLIKNASVKSESEQLYSKFGVRRSNPEIWKQSDWFNLQNQKYNGMRAGLLDMSRYENL